MDRKKLAYVLFGVAGVTLFFALRNRKRNVRADIARLSEAGKYDYFARFIPKNGGMFKTGPNEKNLVGLRVSTDTDTNQGKGAYDDLFVLVWRDSSGTRRAATYPGNTEPSAFYRNKMGIDVDRDGRLDQGRLAPGFFEYVPDTSSQLGPILRPVRDSRVERDVNHDGIFNDKVTSGGGSTMLIHTGGTTNVVSAGCQTMPPPDFRRFLQDVHSGGVPGTVGYTLVETV